MTDRPPNIIICSCEDSMPLDVAAVRRGCRGADVATARMLCRDDLEKYRAAARGPSATDRRLHPGSAAVRRGGKRRRRRALRQHPRDRRMVRPSRCGRSQDGRTPCGRRRAHARDSFHQLRQRGRHPGLRPRRPCDRGSRLAQGSSRCHRLDRPAGGAGTSARNGISSCTGIDPRGQGASRRVRAHRRRLRPPGPVITRRIELRCRARRRDLAVRHLARS